ncbi:MAG: hypothetical protein IT220_02555 [Flavobacteriaceae bacterium]|nr:hypothetical protein [Flavobacteriaceae bacterium]
MLRPGKIDLFELSDKILNHLNSDGKLKLTHYDYSLKFRRDINHPSDKFNIDLVLFGEEITVSYYTVNYFSVDQIFKLFFVHLRDDYGYENIEDAVIATKRISLSNNLKETIHEIDAMFKLQNIREYTIFVDEKYPYDQVDEKGIPFFELNVYSEEKALDLKIELSWISSDYNDKKRILEIIHKKLNCT